MQRYLYEHSQLPGHTGLFEDIYVTLIDKTDPWAPTKREDYWIPTLKAKALCDLMFRVVTEVLSYIVVVQLFLFLDLDDLL